MYKITIISNYFRFLMILIFVCVFATKTKSQPFFGDVEAYRIYLPNKKANNEMKVFNVYLKNTKSGDTSYFPESIVEDLLIQKSSPPGAFQNLNNPLDTLTLFFFLNFNLDRIFNITNKSSSYYFIVSPFIEENITLNSLPDKDGVYIIDQNMRQGEIDWDTYTVAQTKNCNRIKSILLGHELQLGFMKIVDYSALNARDLYRGYPEFYRFIAELNPWDRSFSFFYTYPYARACIELIRFDRSSVSLENYIQENANHMSRDVMRNYFENRNIDIKPFIKQMDEFNSQVDSLKWLAPKFSK